MKMYVGKRMLFLSSWPYGELREVVILGKKTPNTTYEDNKYYFGKLTGGSDSTTMDFLFESPGETQHSNIIDILKNFGLGEELGKEL